MKSRVTITYRVLVGMAVLLGGGTANGGFPLVDGMSIETANGEAAQVKIEKRVVTGTDSNATLRITTFSSPETVGGVPNVLFLGTVCDGHGLTENTIARSLNAITEKGNVTYYLFGKSDYYDRQGTLRRGEKATATSLNVRMDHPQHAALGKFYDRLYKALSSNVAYDYIVFEFDGSRIADGYDSPNGHEAWVAGKLRAFYAEGRVIQIVDDCFADRSGQGEEVWGGTDYWRVNSYYNRGRGYDTNMGFVPYRGLVGLFSPADYSTQATRLSQISTERRLASPKNMRLQTFYANPRYGIQANYSNVEELVDFLRRSIQVRPYNLQIRDKVLDPMKGLSVVAGRLQVCTNGVGETASTREEDWIEVLTWTDGADSAGNPELKGSTGIGLAFGAESNSVSVVLSNVQTRVWTRMDLSVLDDGTFCNREDLISFDAETGLCEKDPNDGPARVEMFTVADVPMGIGAEATTSVFWTFHEPRVTSLWITDHADAGSRFVHLAFELRVNGRRPTRAFVERLAARGGIQIVRTAPGMDLEQAPRQSVPLRAFAWDRDFATRGWVWVTVPVPENSEGQSLCRIVLAND